MILALKDYDACYAALKKTRQVVTVLEAARRMHSWLLSLQPQMTNSFGVFCSCQISQDYL